MADYITPVVGYFECDLKVATTNIRSEIQALRTDLRTWIDRINDRIDRHLENHPRST